MMKNLGWTGLSLIKKEKCSGKVFFNSKIHAAKQQANPPDLLHSTMLFLSLVFIGLLSALPAFAWNEHEHLMSFILDTSSPKLRQFLDRKVTVPCLAEDLKMFSLLASQLLLNPKNGIPPTSSSGKCGSDIQMPIFDILAGGAVDDPDRGFDKDLPSEPGNPYDPNNDRIWMGGYTGPSSQGFRHMLFGGWKLNQPITTFQIPFHSIGQAPKRFDMIANKAKELMQMDSPAWGARLTGWSMHYIQDLAQPFHSAQLIHLDMVPWSELWSSWPPRQAFDTLRKQTTRIITNYHWAYEGYIQFQVEKGKASPFAECLTKPENYSKLIFDPKNQPLIELAYLVAEKSIQLAPQLGSSEIAFFGTQLKDPSVDLTQNPKFLNFSEYSTRPDLEIPRQKLHQVTCEALANASLASRWLMEWMSDNNPRQTRE